MNHSITTKRDTKSSDTYNWNSSDDSANEYPAMEKKLYEALGEYNATWTMTGSGRLKHKPVRPKPLVPGDNLTNAQKDRLLPSLALKNIDREDKWRVELKKYHDDLDLAANRVPSVFTPGCAAHSMVHKLLHDENLKPVTRMKMIMEKIKEKFMPSSDVRVELLRNEMFGYTDEKGFVDFHNKFQTIITEIEELGGDVDEPTMRGWIIRGVKHIELKKYRDDLQNHFDKSLTASKTLTMMSTHWHNYLRDHPTLVLASTAAIRDGGSRSCWSCGSLDHLSPDCNAAKCERCGIYLPDGDARRAHGKFGACSKSAGGYRGDRGGSKRGHEYRGSGGASGTGSKRKTSGDGGNSKKMIKVGADKYAALTAELKALKAGAGSRQTAGTSGST